MSKKKLTDRNEVEIGCSKIGSNRNLVRQNDNLREANIENWLFSAIPYRKYIIVHRMQMTKVIVRWHKLPRDRNIH